MPTVPTFCGKDCGGTCPLLAHIEAGRVVRVTNNPAGGRYLRGCPRGFQLARTTYAPDRLLTPLVRTGRRGSGQFRPASWEEALRIAAESLGDIWARFGPQAVLNLGSAGSVGALHSTSRLLDRFLACSGGYTGQSGNYSNAAAGFVLPYLLGDEWQVAGFDAATVQYAKLIILWGANPLDTRMGTELPLRLAEARRKGAEIIVIDPRRSATARQLAARWLPCRPGTDAALMLAVLYVLIREDRVDRPFLEAHSTGFAGLEAYVLGQTGSPACTPEWAEAICGLPRTEIVRLAHDYAGAHPTMLIPGYSIQRVYAGEETYRLAVALQVATGNFGVPGGSTGALNNRLPAPRAGRLPVPPLPPQPRVPVVRWPDAVLEGRAGGFPTDIHAIYALGSNFVNQGAEVHKSRAAFQKVDFAICHDFFLTPTAQLCDVVLPAATPLEFEDICTPWLGNYLLYKPRAAAPLGEARDDYEILADLAGRLGFGERFTEGRSAAGWVDLFIEQSEVPDPTAFRHTGIYLAPEQERVGLAEFTTDPLGHPLTTPSGKIEISSSRYQAETGFSPFPIWQPAPLDPRYPLRLITPKLGLFTHSQGSNIAFMRARAGAGLSLHPADAARRGIAEGDWVRIFNDHGAVRAVAHLSGDLMPGVVCLPEGIWAVLDEQGEDLSGSANLLTGTQGAVPSSGCIMHGVGVEVSPLPAAQTTR